jgi:hypothetical protein
VHIAANRYSVRTRQRYFLGAAPDGMALFASRLACKMSYK